MDRSSKLTTIRFVRDRLKELDWEDQSLHLGMFGFPSPEYNMTVQDCLLQGDNAALQEIASYLRGEENLPLADNGTLTATRLQVFASHLTRSKVFVADFGQQLRTLGIDLFVAHESIIATRRWADEIEANLRSCHAGIVFLEEKFIESQWCDQEVGWLLGRGVPLPTLKIDGTDPYGPLGQRQAIQAAGKQPYALVDQVVEAFRAEPVLAPHMAESLTQALIASFSWDNTRHVWKHLQHYRELTLEQCTRIENAIPANGELLNASIRHEDGTWEPFRDVFAKFKREQAAVASAWDAPF